MADVFTLTPQPIRRTSTGKQPLDQAIDVSEYDHISALLSALSLDGTSPAISFSIDGMLRTI